MIPSGTTIDRMVRGWRSRLASETGATSDSEISGTGSRVSGAGTSVGVIDGGGRLHGVRPYRSGRAVRHRTMVLPVGRPAHGRGSGGRAGRPAGWIRPFPRTRWTTLETGVSSRAK